MSRFKEIIPRSVRIANRVHSRIPRAWHLLNADKKVVGRVADAAAHLLQGKHKPVFHRSRDVGDFVVIVNAEFSEFKGKKWKKKVYRHHTGYPGGLKEIPASLMRDTKPERILERAIKGKLPKNAALRRKQMERLKVYAGDFHPHDRQLMQIPEDEKHEDHFDKFMHMEVTEVDWTKFEDYDKLIYKNNEPTPEHGIIQYDFDDVVEPKN
mmetsp:Transcript_21771/g.32405  ORF Transcript_21771/g.32405 Transcript_21771/m.32405 type:complete len:210 (-) Transcript_21771:306-935(-)